MSSRARPVVPPPDRPPVRRAAARVLTLLWRSAPLHALGYTAATLLGAVVPVAVAWLTKLTLDRVAAPGPVGAVLGLAVGLAVTGTVAAAVPQVGLYLRAELDRRASVRAKDELFGAIARMPGLAGLEDPVFLDRVRLGQQVAANPDRLFESGLLAIRSALTAVGFIGSLAAVSWVFTVVVTAAAVPAFLIELQLSRQRLTMMWRANSAERREFFYGSLLSTSEAAKEIRLFALGGFLRGRMLAEVRRANAARRQVDRRDLLRHCLLGIAAAAISGAGLIWGVVQAAHGRLGVGDVSLLTAATTGVLQSTNLMVGAAGMAHQQLRMFGHFVAVTDGAPDLPLAAAPVPLPPLRRGIELHDVWFRYSDEHAWILRGINLTIPCGQTVALVGANGAGKSTLVKLLCRFYDPTRGRITWDGLDIRDVAPEQLRDRIGAVFQDFVSYEFSAADNIAVGDLDADERRIEQAARDAGLHETLSALPRGYQTLLTRAFGDDPDDSGDEHTGVVLSGGQWQRVALARGFLRRDRDLMILDEPSAGLDAAAEHDLHTRLHTIRADRTSLLISHRLGAVRDADHIIVLADGRVSEQGGHSELLAAHGRYAHLFTVQAAGYRDDGAAAPDIPAVPGGMAR